MLGAGRMQEEEEALLQEGAAQKGQQGQSGRGWKEPLTQALWTPTQHPHQPHQPYSLPQ